MLLLKVVTQCKRHRERKPAGKPKLGWALTCISKSFMLLTMLVDNGMICVRVCDSMYLYVPMLHLYEPYNE